VRRSRRRAEPTLRRSGARSPRIQSVCNSGHCQPTPSRSGMRVSGTTFPQGGEH